MEWGTGESTNCGGGGRESRLIVGVGRQESLLIVGVGGQESLLIVGVGDGRVD